MPYINANITKELSLQDKEKIKSELGKAITLLGKSEAHLMIDIEDKKTMFFKGKIQDCAYVDIRVYGKCQIGVKENFTKAVFDIFKKELGLNEDSLFLSFLEYENWGLNGGLI